MKRAFYPVILSLFMVMILGSALTAMASRTAGTAIDDATITTKVKYELADDVKFSTLKGVQVDTDRGVVTLTGKVYSSREKKHAGYVARRVNGVVGVRNLLAIVRHQ
jgi:osmotically-inducible protein OsmY